MLYGYDSINDRFVQLKDLKYIKYYPDETFTADCIPHESGKQEKLNVKNMYNIFGLSDDNKLKYSGNMPLTNGNKTYSLKFTKDGDRYIGLTGFEEGLKFFK